MLTVKIGTPGEGPMLRGSTEVKKRVKRRKWFMKNQYECREGGEKVMEQELHRPVPRMTVGSQ